MHTYRASDEAGPRGAFAPKNIKNFYLFRDVGRELDEGEPGGRAKEGERGSLFCFNQVIIEGFEQVIVLFGKIRCNFFCMFFIKYN
jgi:hypothetical protein